MTFNIEYAPDITIVKHQWWKTTSIIIWDEHASSFVTLDLFGPSDHHPNNDIEEAILEATKRAAQFVKTISPTVKLKTIRRNQLKFTASAYPEHHKLLQHIYLDDRETDIIEPVKPTRVFGHPSRMPRTTGRRNVIYKTL